MTQKLTIRLPKDLSDDLSLLGKELGMSKSDMIKTSILKYLVTNDMEDFKDFSIDKKEVFRSTMNVSDSLYKILEKQAKKYGTTINFLIIFSAKKTFDYYSDILKSINIHWFIVLLISFYISK